MSYKNIHVILGTDDATVKETAAKLVEQLTPADAGDFGLETIDGTAGNTDEAVNTIGATIGALQTLPFFGGGKVVWLKSTNIFADSVTGRSSGTLEAAESLIEILEQGLPDEVHFVLNATEIDKRRSFYKKLSKLSKPQIFDRPDTSRAGWEQAVMGLVAQRARERKLKFQPEALEFFVMRAGADSRQIENELEKIDLFLGDGEREVSTLHVRRLVSQSHAGIIWEIGDAISKRHLPRALDLIDQFMYRGENAVGILLAAIIPKIRTLLVAKDLVDQHNIRASSYNQFNAALDRLDPRFTRHLPKKKDGSISAYPVFLATQDCRRFELDQLKSALSDCLDANRRLVTSGLDPKLVLDQLVIRLLT
ncbi:MAG: DNA polymerase III subunit delta [Verrucomicrobiota bacterium]